MKRILFIVILVLFALSSTAVAEYYKIYVKRVDRNLYKDTNSGVYIKTKLCLHLTFGENAILKYEDLSYDNKLIFEDGDSCDVVGVFK